MSKTINQINEESRATVKAVYPDAYYDSQFSAVYDDNDKVIAYGMTANCAWYEAAEVVKALGQQ